jgi:phage/plasmid primase-like uncharacterized protein
MAGACPKCGGKDRFVYKTDSHKSWCRNCVHENKPMDIINFHCWLYNKTVKELIHEHLPPETDNNPDFNSKWLQIVNRNIDTAHCYQLCKKRGITDDVTESLIKQGKITSCDYMDKKAVAFPFTDMAGNVIFIQYLTADENKFPHIESKKSFNKGSHISQDGFFQCGKSIHEDSKGIILVEGVINAISGSQVLPDYTWLATGSANSTQKKVHNLKPYISDAKPLICAFDNDKAGNKTTEQVKRVMKNSKISSIIWNSNDPAKCDINDLLCKKQNPQRLVDLISNAESTASVKETDSNHQFNLKPVIINTADIDNHNQQPSPKPIIILKQGEQYHTVKQCEQILIDDGCIYQRGNLLFRISSEVNKPKDDIINERSYYLQEVTSTWLKMKLNEKVDFIYIDKQGNTVFKDCPKDIAESILADSGAWSFPYINGVCEIPTLRKDGSVIQTAGYDNKSGIYIVIDDNWNIPEHPTKEDALKAYDKLETLVKDFSFTDEESKTAVISSILTGVVRKNLPSAPLFCFDAPKRGSGKTLLADTIGNIITGQAITTINQGRDEIEFSKRIDSIIFRGDSVINIDNVEHAVSGDALNSVLTSEFYNPRILGKSEIPKCATNILWLMTGNNVTFKGDMVRRVIISRIDPQCENPEEREFDIDLREYALNNRRELVTAALTIIRAYFTAGCPQQDIPNYGSFETWCKFARNPLVWLGKADPCKSRAKVKDSDPITGNLKELLEAFHNVYGTKEVTARQITEDAVNKFTGKFFESVSQDDKERLLNILEIVAMDDTGNFNTKRLGNFIAKYRDRIEGNLRFVQSGTVQRAGKYIVQTIEPLQRPSLTTQVSKPEELIQKQEEPNQTDDSDLNVNSGSIAKISQICSVCVWIASKNSPCSRLERNSTKDKCENFEPYRN